MAWPYTSLAEEAMAFQPKVSKPLVAIFRLSFLLPT
jgi:hypothetical protein